MIEQTGAGEWVLSMGAGKSVLIDGEITKEPVVLEVGMNLILGQDHLRCVTESLDRAGMKAQTAVDGLDETLAPRFFALRRWAKRLRLEWWMLGLGIGIGMALGLVFMARG